MWSKRVRQQQLRKRRKIGGVDRMTAVASWGGRGGVATVKQQVPSEGN